MTPQSEHREPTEHQEPSGRPRTLAVFTEWAAERYPDRPALRFRDAAGGWVPVTYTELRATVRRTALGLLALGIGAGDRVAILAETRPEWTYAHFACLAVGAVVVPVYPTAGDEETSWVLSDSGAKAVFCEGPAEAARVAELRPKLPALAHVLPMTGPDGPAAAGGATEGPTAAGGAEVSLGDLLARAEAVRPEDDAELVYTSGTTGLPKGCRLTHGNLGAVQDATLHLIQGGPGDRTYLYLPLAHLLAQLIQFSTLLYGGELCYFGGRIEDVVGELAEAQPTHLPSVPRLFEKVYSVVRSLAEAEEGGAERFDAAVAVGVLAADGELPPERRAAYEAADASLFSLVRAAFGGRLRWALTGGAPIDPAVLDFLRACGIQVFEGYGMTESAGVISLNHPGAVRYGTVGRPVLGCEVRIADDEEVLARGPMVFPGYHANPGGTADALDAEGWLHTGDLGAVDADGYLTITGRKKDLIITSAGKNLTPSHVELAIERSRFVSHAVMAGDRRPYPVALITVEAEAVAGRDAAEVRELVGRAVAEANEQVSRPARIRAFAVLPRDFTVEGGELTPTLKVRRRVVLDRYAQEIAALYK
ncbi:long-chain fatty acid--CoA ligase [Streptomyces sp. NBC_00083]|uniref:AMP-dependent synthetase/ligase n=1 Tax=Streptomyces sp. NBC_00083 TaxID=2975647 RepID=UPI00225A017C|nr:AMP-dependent synthetase/ligase [Streptomyces sp. NBC_00083]MCX5384942.1 AMP-dependent synthetase/ligase [Streptomyces sp. NBC_00083]